MFIKTNILYRLSKVCKNFELNTPEEIKNALNVIRIEIKDKKGYAIATNQQIAVIEYLGEIDESDKVFHLKMTEKFLKFVECENWLDTITSIEVTPEILLGKLSTSMGHNDNDCFAWIFDTPLAEWRTWLDNLPSENKGAMYWELYHVKSLFESSSGNIVFPKLIDVEKPLILRDVENPNWLGIFIPSTLKSYKPSELPTWL